ncbi:MAG: NAD-dependent epimerase/dehydratase family protein [Stackebrandtia sp.]
MILVTGGLGFIGAHTVRALLDLGESCVVAQRNVTRRPALFADEIGKRVHLEQLDVTDLPALLELGERYDVTGIVHLAAAHLSGLDPVDELRVNTAGLLNMFQAARDWRVRRIGVASTIGVYIGAAGSRWREDVPLPAPSFHAIPAVKKSAEILGSYVESSLGVEVVCLRIGAIWGPLGHKGSPFIAITDLVHAALAGAEPDLSAYGPVYAENGGDLCYAKDCGRAIATLQLADDLPHRTYNISSGLNVTNDEVVAAIAKTLPEAKIDIREGRNPDGPAENLCLDITRLREDTGFSPAYDLESAVADYVDWLRSGNEI